MVKLKMVSLSTYSSELVLFALPPASLVSFARTGTTRRDLCFGFSPNVSQGEERNRRSLSRPLRSVFVKAFSTHSKSRMNINRNVRTWIGMCDANQNPDEIDDSPSSWQFAYVLSTIASAVAGGRMLPLSSGIFFFIARALDTPLWLTASASIFSSILLELLIIRVLPLSSFAMLSSPESPQNIVLPYIVFILGCVTTIVFDFDGFFQTLSPGGRDTGSNPPKPDFNNMLGRSDQLRGTDELSEWDASLDQRSAGDNGKNDQPR